MTRTDTSSPSPTDVHRQIESALSVNNTPEAERLLVEALVQTPEDDQLQALMAELACQLGRLDESQGYAQTAQSLNDDNDLAHALLSRLALERGDHSLALMHAEAACRINSLRADNQLALARSLASLDDHQAALDAGRKAIADRPTDAGLHGFLGDLALKLDDAEEAAYFYRQAIQLQPSSARMHHALGLALMQSQQWAHSVDHLVEAVTLQPDELRFRDSLVSMISDHLEGRDEPPRLRAWESLSGSTRLMYWRHLRDEKRRNAIFGMPRDLVLVPALILVVMISLWLLGLVERRLLTITVLVSGLWFVIRLTWRLWREHYKTPADR